MPAVTIRQVVAHNCLFVADETSAGAALPSVLQPSRALLPSGWVAIPTANRPPAELPTRPPAYFNGALFVRPVVHSRQWDARGVTLDFDDVPLLREESRAAEDPAYRCLGHACYRVRFEYLAAEESMAQTCSGSVGKDAALNLAAAGVDLLRMRAALERVALLSRCKLRALFLSAWDFVQARLPRLLGDLHRVSAPLGR